MRKSTLFISAVLTTFVLAMLAGVASAYQNLVVNDQMAKEQTETTLQEQPDVQTVAQAAAPVAEEPANLTPQEVATLAAQVMGSDNLYSIEVTELNGETVYLVTFTSGELLYISLDGQILSIDKVEVETVVVNVSTGGGGGGGGEPVDQSNSSPSSGRGEGDDQGDDDHEEDEDHEDEDREDEDHEDEDEDHDD